MLRRLSPRWQVLLAVHAGVFAYGVTLQAIPPLLPFLVADLGLDRGEVGALMGLFSLPGIFLSLPAGYLSDRWGPRRVGGAALALMAAGSALGLLYHPLPLLAGRLLAGVGGCILIVAGPQSLSRLFAGREVGTAMGLFNTAFPLGTVLCLAFAGSAAGSWGPRSVFLAVTLLDFLALFLFLRTFGRIPVPLDPVPPHPLASLRGMGRPIKVLALAWGFYNLAILGFFTFGADFLRAGGMAPGGAAFWAALPMLLSLGGVPLVGRLLDRHRWRNGPLLAGFSLTGVGLALLSLLPGVFLPGTVPWGIVILGIGVSLAPPAGLSLMGELSPPGRTGTGFGVVNTLFNLFLFAGIPLAGWLRVWSGDYGWTFLFLSAAGLGAALAVPSLRQSPP